MRRIARKRPERVIRQNRLDWKKVKGKWIKVK